MERMLYNTVELIIQASSNFHLIFCFCNLIIISLFIAEGSKPRTRYAADNSTGTNPPVKYLKTSNASSIKGDDEQHNSSESELPSDSQDGIFIKGSSDDHDMINQMAIGGDDDGDDEDGKATFVEQGKLIADSADVGSREIQIYTALFAANKEDKEGSEDQKQKPEEGDGDADADVDVDDDDELRRKIEDFIDKVNKEWREELRTSHKL